MLKLQSPLAGSHTLRPKSGRKPLQPKNALSNPLTEIQILKPKLKLDRIDSNKENQQPVDLTPAKLIKPLDASLAEELSSIKKKLERLRLDRERTEEMLKERGAVMDLQMKEMEKRGEAQKMLEIEVDRLFRLKELQSYSMRISPIQSLREKEHEKKFAQQEQKDLGEAMVESELQSPSSSSNSNSIS